MSEGQYATYLAKKKRQRAAKAARQQAKGGTSDAGGASAAAKAPPAAAARSSPGPDRNVRAPTPPAGRRASIQSGQPHVRVYRPQDQVDGAARGRSATPDRRARPSSEDARRDRLPAQPGEKGRSKGKKGKKGKNKQK